MGKHSRESKLSLLILLILYGIADIRSSLPVELTSEEKGNSLKILTKPKTVQNISDYHSLDILKEPRHER